MMHNAHATSTFGHGAEDGRILPASAEACAGTALIRRLP